MKVVTSGDPVVNISVEGDAGDISNVAGDVSVSGNCKTIKTTSGDIKAGNVNGGVSSISGDIEISGNVSGDVKNMHYMFFKSPLEKNPPKWYKE